MFVILSREMYKNGRKEERVYKRECIQWHTRWAQEEEWRVYQRVRLRVGQSARASVTASERENPLRTRESPREASEKRKEKAQEGFELGPPQRAREATERSNWKKRQRRELNEWLRMEVA